MKAFASARVSYFPLVEALAGFSFWLEFLTPSMCLVSYGVRLGLVSDPGVVSLN